MEVENSELRLAVLIDADNIPARVCEPLFQEIATYGIASAKRAYGDWTIRHLSRWKSILHENAISPVQVFSYSKGKNSSDSALIIDAMDLLYSGRFDGFCIVSSDSDFTRLATRIREAGLKVFGFGEKKTLLALQAACDSFVSLEAIVGNANDNPHSEDTEESDMHIFTDQQETPVSEVKIEKVQTATRLELRQDTTLVNLLRGAVDATMEDDGWSNAANVGFHIKKRSSFDQRNFGYRKLGELLEASDLFDIEKRGASLYLKDNRN